MLAELDRTDRRLLQELQRDGRVANAELAQRVGLSESACLRRVKALEEAGEKLQSVRTRLSRVDATKASVDVDAVLAAVKALDDVVIRFMDAK